MNTLLKNPVLNSNWTFLDHLHCAEFLNEQFCPKVSVFISSVATGFSGLYIWSSLPWADITACSSQASAGGLKGSAVCKIWSSHHDAYSQSLPLTKRWNCIHNLTIFALDTGNNTYACIIIKLIIILISILFLKV